MINRRRFVGSLAYGVCTAASSRAAAPRIDGGIIRSQIEALSVFGRPPGGTFQDSVSRVGYSDADIAGRKYVMDLMRRAGASVRIDAAGNIFASRSGSDPSLKPVLFGSHIDSVPNGGNFDGDLGSPSARTSTRSRTAATSTAISDRSRRSPSCNCCTISTPQRAGPSQPQFGQIGRAHV